MSRRIVWLFVLSAISVFGLRTGLAGASAAAVAKLCATGDCCNSCEELHPNVNCQGCNSTVEDAKCIDPAR
jgi:hypothetical protein